MSFKSEQDLIAYASANKLGYKIANEGIHEMRGLFFVQKTADNFVQQAPFDELLTALSKERISFQIRNNVESNGWHETLIVIPVPLMQMIACL